MAGMNTNDVKPPSNKGDYSKNSERVETTRENPVQMPTPNLPNNEEVKIEEKLRAKTEHVGLSHSRLVEKVTNQVEGS